MSTISVWLDDIRPTPSGYTHTARTAEEAIDLLKTGRVSIISLDHDLGDEKITGSGYDVAAFIEQEAFFDRIPRLLWHIHSQNSVGVKNMTAALTAAEKSWERHGTLFASEK